MRTRDSTAGRKRLGELLSAALCGCVLVGCSVASPGQMAAMRAEMRARDLQPFNAPSPPGPRGWEAQEPAKTDKTSAAADEEARVPLQQRVVVYNATFHIVVQSVEDALRGMEQIAAQAGGYVQQIRNDMITIRVPAPQYSAAVEHVAGLGQVSDRKLETIDVTDEYVDLQVRLENARNVRKRLEALLEKAENVEAALEVERELGRVTGEIERLEAQLELLKKRVAYSTITVQFERVARQGEAIRGFRQLPFHWLRELDPNRLWWGY